MLLTESSLYQMNRVKNQWELSTKPLRLSIDAHTPQDGEFESNSYQFKHREGVHIHHDYHPTFYPIKHAYKNNNTSTDCVIQTRTKLIGRANKRGWATPSTSPKKVKQQANASKWLNNNAHKL